MQSRAGVRTSRSAARRRSSISVHGRPAVHTDTGLDAKEALVDDAVPLLCFLHDASPDDDQDGSSLNFFAPNVRKGEEGASWSATPEPGSSIFEQRSISWGTEQERIYEATRDADYSVQAPLSELETLVNDPTVGREYDAVSKSSISAQRNALFQRNIISESSAVDSLLGGIITGAWVYWRPQGTLGNVCQSVSLSLIPLPTKFICHGCSQDCGPQSRQREMIQLRLNL